ncbi:hypothetical protein CC86DRAFT_193801 [Ophiobolus disseminans]|uniref:Uncharacterized protein n=1 Tax=Ophiobolus disseminans TaxID=1469910 RepID=A0A6A7A7B4_9PLEO|nr:hypothetical protein CC86DRAFT_193801 [Ophiobolus disseminans]
MRACALQYPPSSQRMPSAHPVGACLHRQVILDLPAALDGALWRQPAQKTPISALQSRLMLKLVLCGVEPTQAFDLPRAPGVH